MTIHVICQGGVNETVSQFLQMLMWDMIDEMDITKDYLQIFNLVIMHKEDADGINNFNTVIEEAVKLGIERFGDKIQNPQNPLLPIRDGDDGTTGDIAYENSFYFNTSTPIRPRIVNKKCVDEAHDESYYEYRYARISMNLIPYAMDGKLGISFRLNHVQIFPERFDVSQNMSSPIEDFS